MKKRIVSLILVCVLTATSIDVTSFASEMSNEEVIEAEDENVEETGDDEYSSSDNSNELKDNEGESVEKTDDGSKVDESIESEDNLESSKTMAEIEESSSDNEDETEQVEHKVMQYNDGDDISIQTETFSGKCGDNLTWVIENDTLTISGTGDMWDYSDGNGSSYNKNQITPAPWGSYLSMADKLVLEEGITRIGSCAFENCNNLKGELLIPDSVVIIGTRAFAGCSGFTGDLILPSNIENLYNSAFEECKGFSGRLVISDATIQINQNVFKNCSGFTGDLIIPNSVIGIDKYAFYGCSGFDGILKLGENIDWIQYGAFSGCKGLIGDLEIPNSVTMLGRADGNYEGVFSGCSSLNGNLVIGNNVEIIGAHTFYRCNNLKGNLNIPNSVTDIGMDAFGMCSGFTGDLIIPDSVKEIQMRAFFDCSGFTGDLIIGADNIDSAFGSYSAHNWTYFGDIYNFTGDLVISSPNYILHEDEFRGAHFGGTLVLADTIKSIGKRAFYDCYGFQGKLVLPNKVTEICEEAFYGCKGFSENLIIPSSVETIGNSAFYGCTGFDGNLALPNSLTSIGDSAFSGCSSFTGNLIISDSITQISSSAFSGCSGFTGNLTIPNSVTTIGSSAFYNCDGLDGNLTIPDSVIIIEDYAFYNCSGLDGNLTIPNSVTSIGNYAFSGCSGLTGNLAIPDSVTSIGNSAFENCSGFTGNLLIPDSLTKIDSKTFKNCSGFTGDLTIPDSVTSIGNSAFENCSGFTGDLVISNSLTKINSETFKNCNGFTGSLVISNSVTEIGSDAFNGCSGFAGNLILHENINSIGGYAFASCTSIDNVIFEGNAPSIGSYAFSLVETTIYYPSWTTGWTSIKGNNYGGTLTWIPYDEGTEPWNMVYVEGAPFIAVIMNGAPSSLTYDGAEYVPSSFEANFIVYYMEFDHPTTYENVKVSIELPDGLSFEENSDKTTLAYKIETMDSSDANKKAVLEPIKIYADGDYVTDKFIIKASVSAEGFEKEQISFCDISVENIILTDDTSVDEFIIAEVTKYTSDELYAQYNAIMSSGLGNEEKLKLLNELSHNNGITDVREGIKYLSGVSSYRRNYLYLITNENYCSFNWWYWLNDTIKGKIARGLLYADGLIFNYELSSYIDWTTYADNSYPGVEKCKTMLKNFMEANDNNSIISDVASNSKKVAKWINNAVKINNIVVDAELDKIMDNVMNAKTKEELEKYQNQFADVMIRQAKINQKIDENGEVKLYLGADAIAKVMGYATPIITVTSNTANDIVDIINLEEDIEKYEEYKYFLTEIYTNNDVSEEMRIAAYQLCDEIKNGYYNEIKSILSNFITFETKMMYIDKSLLETYLESKGLSTATTSLLGEALGTITLASVITNIFIDSGDFVKQAAYTMSYAEIATLFSFKLQDDREKFRNNPTAENAWQFYEDYNLLWKLRYKGEEQYLKMNTVKAFIFGSIKAQGYSYKEQVVNDVLSILDNCKFELADTVEFPESVQYLKKSVIECPVDVLVYTKDGVLITEMKDGVQSDVSNEYGRFVVVYESYSDDYAKVICQSTDEELVIKLVSVDNGFVDYKTAGVDSDEILSFSNVQIAENDEIEIDDGKYTISSGRDDVSDITISLENLPDEYINVQSVSLNENNVEISIGEEKVVGISVLPNNATCQNVTWYSEDEDVATVKNGVITAQSAGNTVIWATSCDDAEIYDSINITVVASKNASEIPDKGDVIAEDIPDDGVIPEGLWIAGVGEYPYTGKAIKPEVHVYDYMTLLTEKTDYTISYKNNTNANSASDTAKAPTITVTGKGNYSGKETANFTILPIDLGDELIEVEDIASAKTGKTQKPTPTVKFGTKKLSVKKDFTVSYPDSSNGAYTDAGTYSIEISGTGNYTGTRTISFTITENTLISKAKVSTVKPQEYTGQAITPEVSVSYGKTSLTIDSDYTVTYSNNVKVGTAKIIITGKGSYAGTKTVTFKITGSSISKASVANLRSSVQYSGSEVNQDCKLTATVAGATKTLSEDTDYTVSYSNNTKTGTATVVFTGINGFTGTLKKTFKITPYNINTDSDKKISIPDNISAAYAKGGSTPKPEIKFGSTVLKEGVDYTLSYKNNKAVSGSKKPEIVIKGKGNFTGTYSTTFEITQQDISNITVNVADKVYQNKSGIYKSTPKLIDTDGKALTAGKDYDKNVVYTYADNTTLGDGTTREAGTEVGKNDIIPALTKINVTINALGGNYTGSVTGTFRIVKSDISKAKVTVKTLDYTGKEVKPAKSDITVKVGKDTLDESMYEITGYGDKCINKGKNTVTIRGLDNYGGTKTATYTIKAKGFFWWWRNAK